MVDKVKTPKDLDPTYIILKSKPSFPRYRMFETRLESFKYSKVRSRFSHCDFANAGFFHTGIADQTICFNCGGGLKDWEIDVDPWIEHARWFSKCQFLLLKRGIDFVDEVCGRKKKTQPTTEEEESDPPTAEPTSEVVVLRTEEEEITPPTTEPTSEVVVLKETEPLGAQLHSLSRMAQLPLSSMDSINTLMKDLTLHMRIYENATRAKQMFEKVQPVCFCQIKDFKGARPESCPCVPVIVQKIELREILHKMLDELK